MAEQEPVHTAELGQGQGNAVKLASEVQRSKPVIVEPVANGALPSGCNPI